MLELKAGVARACLPFTAIYTRVAQKSTIHRLLASFHNSRWMDHWEVCHGSIEAISILDPGDVEEAYSHIASRHQSIQRDVQSHGWYGASCGQKENSMERRLVLHCEVSSTKAVQILHRSDCNNRHASHCYTYPRFVPEVAIIQKVGQGNGY